MSIAVVKDRRRAGVGTALVRAAADRAAELHYRRIVLHTTRRSAAVRQLATHVGWLVITGDRGRTEVFLDVAVDADAAGSIRSA
jgi:GNAT superfamily N-acetyltransferase